MNTSILNSTKSLGRLQNQNKLMNKTRYHLLLFLIGLILFSCNSSPNEEGTNQLSESDMDIVPDEPIEPEEKESLILVQSEQRRFRDGNLFETIIMDYSNKKPEIWSFYNSSNQLTYTTEWSYYENGYLSKIEGHLPDGTLDFELNIDYDTSGRIISTTSSQESGSFVTTTSFTHNEDLTISSRTDFAGNLSFKSFETNENGVVEREIVDGNTVVSVQYDGLDPISKTSFSTTQNYTYSNEGLAPLVFSSLFGPNPVNVVLFQNSLNDSSDSLTGRLISEINSDSSTQEYIYVLNEANFPLTREYYENGSLIDEFDYRYE